MGQGERETEQIRSVRYGLPFSPRDVLACRTLGCDIQNEMGSGERREDEGGFPLCRFFPNDLVCPRGCFFFGISSGLRVVLLA